MTESFIKYRAYTISQFVLDDAFIDWVKAPNEERMAFWEEFQEKVPQQKEKIILARAMILDLKMEKEIVDEGTKDRLWSRIRENSAVKAPVVRMINWRMIGVAAAVLIIVLSIAYFKTFTRENREVIQTAFGEKRSITLPDRSVVVLNAASKIEFHEKWEAGSPREVWVDGEAFFDVVHINQPGSPVNPSERFIVHLKNMDVEVLGTRFSVNTRRNEEQVVLETGSVKVALKNKSKEVFLKPGEMLRLSAGTDSVKKEETNAETQSSWKNNQLIFNNTSLAEIAMLIEDNYGYKVEISDTSLLNKTFAGTLSSENEEILFKALETMLDVRITVQNKIVTISKK